MMPNDSDIDGLYWFELIPEANLSVEVTIQLINHLLKMETNTIPKSYANQKKNAV